MSDPYGTIYNQNPGPATGSAWNDQWNYWFNQEWTRSKDNSAAVHFADQMMAFQQPQMSGSARPYTGHDPGMETPLAGRYAGTPSPDRQAIHRAFSNPALADSVYSQGDIRQQLDMMTNPFAYYPEAQGPAQYLDPSVIDSAMQPEENPGPINYDMKTYDPNYRGFGGAMGRWNYQGTDSVGPLDSMNWQKRFDTMTGNYVEDSPFPSPWK